VGDVEWGWPSALLVGHPDVRRERYATGRIARLPRRAADSVTDTVPPGTDHGSSGTQGVPVLDA